MYVSGFGNYDGFSLGKLTKWVGGTVAAVATGNVAALTAQVTAAIPGATAKPVAQPVVPPKPPGLFAPGGFVEKNQTTLLVVAAGLGAFLLFGRKGRR
jgi:hypothetical protein